MAWPVKASRTRRLKFPAVTLGARSVLLTVWRDWSSYRDWGHRNQVCETMDTCFVVSFSRREVDARQLPCTFSVNRKTLSEFWIIKLLYDDFHVEITHEVVNWSVWVEFTQLGWKPVNELFHRAYVLTTTYLSRQKLPNEHCPWSLW
jgi:hypothetical protein